jgi:hypothetical protein
VTEYTTDITTKASIETAKAVDVWFPAEHINITVTNNYITLSRPRYGGSFVIPREWWNRLYNTINETMTQHDETVAKLNPDPDKLAQIA